MGSQFEGIQSVVVINTWQHKLLAASHIGSAVKQEMSAGTQVILSLSIQPGTLARGCEIHTQTESYLLSQTSLESPSKDTLQRCIS